VPFHPGSLGNDHQCLATTLHGDVLVGEVQSAMATECYSINELIIFLYKIKLLDELVST
jgi:hypothetical protein